MAKTKESKEEYGTLAIKLKELTIVADGTYRRDIGSDKNTKVRYDVED